MNSTLSFGFVCRSRCTNSDPDEPSASEASTNSKSTFAAWLQQRRRRGQTHGDRKATPEKTLRWLEAVVEEAQPAGGPSPSILLVELPGKARLQIRHPEQAVLVAALLRALEQPC